MKLKVKKLHPNAKISPPAMEGDAGHDISCVSIEYKEKYIEYKTGLAITVPKNHVGLLVPRSSITNKGLSLGNSCGILDHGFSGEIRFRFYTNETSELYEVGDRIGQLVIVPFINVDFEEVQELSETERGQGGFGSSGQ